MTTNTRPITVALVNDYPVIVEGLATLLAPDPRLAVMELAVNTEPKHQVDVVLIDAFGTSATEHQLMQLLNDPRYQCVVIYSWKMNEKLVQRALELGVSGYLSKALGAEELIEALLKVHSGERVVSLGVAPEEIELPTWPGRDSGLTVREAEIIALITQGITNEEIAKHCYLSINSVKSYIRSAYRKMGVQRRSQAVLWGVENGMLPLAAKISADEAGLN